MKKMAVLLGSVMLLSSILTGCGGNDGKGDTEEKQTEKKQTEDTAEAQEEKNPDDIVIWAFAEPHAEYFRWVTEEYKKEHPDVSFTIEIMTTDALAERLAVINASGGEGAPDLVDQEQGYFSRFMSEEQMCYYPLDEFMERDSVTEKMVKSRLDLYAYDGHYYGLEHALCPVTMAYRKDLFEEYNISIPTTWDEYKAAAEEFAKHDIYISATKDMSMGGELDDIALMLRAAGVDYVDENGNLNISDEFKEIVEDYIDLQQKGMMYAWEAQDEAWPVIAEDKVATYFTADWAAGWLRDNVPEQSGKWQMAPLPKLTESAAAVSVKGGTGLCMTKYTNKDKEVLWDFMKFAQLDKDNCVKKYEMIALYPPVYDAMPECNSPVEYYNNQNLGELYESLADEIPVQYQADWRNTFIETFSSNAYDLVEGNISMEELAETLTEAVNDYNESK